MHLSSKPLFAAVDGHILISVLTLTSLVQIFLWKGFLGATITQKDSECRERAKQHDKGNEEIGTVIWFGFGIFFPSVTFFTLLSSLLSSSWKKNTEDLRSQFSWLILQPFSRIKKKCVGRGNFSFSSSWCPVRFLLCFLLRKKAPSLLAPFSLLGGTLP